VTTGDGAVGLVTIRGRHRDPTSYITFDLKIWKGAEPAS
jgi:hypothetical protein